MSSAWPPAGVGCEGWPPKPGDVITIQFPATAAPWSESATPSRYLVMDVVPTATGYRLDLLRDPEDEP